jgi:uncharacterized protein (DUF2164 family)
VKSFFLITYLKEERNTHHNNNNNGNYYYNAKIKTTARHTELKMLARNSVPLALVQVLFLFLTLTTTTTLVHGQEEGASCTLECPIDAPCKFGNADFSKHNPVNTDNNINGMHCDCPPGWTGIQCDVMFESCSDALGHYCYNGGDCVPGLKDEFGNTQLFCDCSTAVDHDGAQYTGQYCELPFVEACGALEDGENVFCVNGARCNFDYP